MKLLPGLNLTFSWRRALGLTRWKSRISRKYGVPLTRGGRERKLGRIIIQKLLG